MPRKKQNTKKTTNSLTNENEKAEKEIEEMVQLVVFELDGEEYGVNIIELKEITDVLDITFVPNSPDFILGVTNLRGKVVVVVDLEKRFNLVREKEVSSEKKHVIISEVENNTFGVVVDQVTEILRIPVSKIKKAPSLVSVKINSDFVVGVVVLDSNNNEEQDDEKNNVKSKIKESRLIILIDLLKMLSEKELLEIGDLSKNLKIKE